MLIQEEDKGLFLVNGAPFQPPDVPVLLQILSGAHRTQDLIPHKNIIPLEANKSVELVIPGGVIGGGVCVFYTSSLRLRTDRATAPRSPAWREYLLQSG